MPFTTAHNLLYAATMNHKELFDGCMKLAEFGAGRWDSRRTYEWKLSLGLWALLAAAIYGFRVETIPGWIFVLGMIAYLWWIKNLWWSNYIDRQLMRAYRDHARSLLAAHHIKYEYKFKRDLVSWVADRPNLNSYIGFLFDWSAQFQLTITFTLSYLAFKFCQCNPSWF